MPDNFVQDPYNTQNFNRYGYVLNNPLSYTDPSGEFFWFAFGIGAIIGAVTGAAGYIAHAIVSGNWSWGQFSLSVIGGALIGGLSGGIAPSSAMTGSAAEALLYGAGAFTAGLLPSADFNVGNWNFSVSPSVAFGNGFGAGANFSVSFSDGNFSASVGYGVSYFGSAHGSGAKGWEYRKSWGTGWDDGKNGFGLYSTSFSGLGGKFDQKVGGFSYRNGDFKLRYENDFIKKPLVGIGGVLADGRDRWRTTALQVGYKDYSLNLKFFTGEPKTSEDYRDRSNPGALHGIYTNPEADLYRLGAASFGYKGYQLGYNSESIRGFIQNKVIHNYFTDNSGWFRELPNQFPSSLFFQYQSENRYTLW